jgi:DNA-binding transcriptional LysR family regulator
MNLSGLSLDQFLVFVTVAETGSFSAASRRLNRAQSAVTYAIPKLEDQLGVSLFDRTAYRPSLTEAGAALLPRATRIINDVGAFSDQARGITEGLEPELTIVVDAMFPMDRIVDALRVFGTRYPTVPTRIYVASMGATAHLVVDGTCTLGIALRFTAQGEDLVEHEIDTLRMVAVASQCHPLASIEGSISPDELQSHVQLVLTDPSGRTDKRDYGVLSRRNWRIADLGAKHAMLLGGLGWGGMPLHMVEQDIAAGRLRIIKPEEWGARGEVAALSMCLIHRPDRVLGPAARWLSDWLISGKRGPQRGDTDGFRALAEAAE